MHANKKGKLYVLKCVNSIESQFVYTWRIVVFSMNFVFPETVVSFDTYAEAATYLREGHVI